MGQDGGLRITFSKDLKNDLYKESNFEGFYILLSS